MKPNILQLYAFLLFAVVVCVSWLIPLPWFVFVASGAVLCAASLLMLRRPGAITSTLQYRAVRVQTIAAFFYALTGLFMRPDAPFRVTDNGVLYSLIVLLLLAILVAALLPVRKIAST